MIDKAKALNAEEIYTTQKKEKDQGICMLYTSVLPGVNNLALVLSSTFKKHYVSVID